MGIGREGRASRLGPMNDLRPSKLGIAIHPLAFQAAKRFCIDVANRSESVLLAYARKRLEQLTKELSSYQAEEQKRLDHSLKVQREEDAKLTELKLKQEAERMMAEFETSLKKKVGKLESGLKGFVTVKERSRDINLTLLVSWAELFKSGLTQG